MKKQIISKGIKELATLCIKGEHRQLYLELLACGCEIEFAGIDEEEHIPNATKMAMVECQGVNWLLYLKAGRIVDSDMDSL
jgi:hypothetical protein